MAFINDPNTPANGLAVDSNGSASTTLKTLAGNKAIVTTSDQVDTSGGIVSFISNDGLLYPSRGDRLGSAAIASHNQLFTESFDGTAINAVRWTSTLTTMTMSFASATGALFNASSITTINTGALISSTRRFIKSQRAPLQTKIRARLNHINNSVIELGFGDASTATGTHTTGAYWQVTTGGVLQPVLTFNGVDLTGTSVSFEPTKYYTFDIVLDDDEAIYTIQDTFTGLLVSRQAIKLPLTQGRLWSLFSLPVFSRLYNSGSVPASAPTFIVTDIYVLELDANKNLPWPHICSSLGRNAAELATTGAQNIVWTNSAEPASLTLSNTAAGATTLGGKFQFAAIAGAVTDYCLFAYQVPAGYNLRITGITIDVWNTGAAVATTPTLMTWALGYNSTAVSLATASYNRLGLGAQSLPIGSVVGAVATPSINKQFQTPICVPSARFVAIILRMPVATATASQVIAGMINIEGYYD